LGGEAFHLEGKTLDFAWRFLGEALLRVLSLGLAGARFQGKMLRVLAAQCQLGDLRFRFLGSEGQLFRITLKGVLLSILTLGLYRPWYTSALYRFYLGNLEGRFQNISLSFSTNITGWGLFKNSMKHHLIWLTSLGLSTPWLIFSRRKILLESIFIHHDGSKGEILTTA
jgi:uncharacterized membrane protein YjgN (DUF898 family)